MRVTGKTFDKWLSRILETLKDPEGEVHQFSIFPARLCAMMYINDGRHLPRDAVPELEPVQQAQMNNVEAYQMWLPDSA